MWGNYLILFFYYPEWMKWWGICWGRWTYSNVTIESCGKEDIPIIIKIVFIFGDKLHVLSLTVLHSVTTNAHMLNFLRMCSLEGELKTWPSFGSHLLTYACTSFLEEIRRLLQNTVFSIESEIIFPTSINRIFNKLVTINYFHFYAYGMEN